MRKELWLGMEWGKIISPLRKKKYRDTDNAGKKVQRYSSRHALVLL